jgi:hypothetical protein
MSEMPDDTHARLLKLEQHQIAQRIAIATLASLLQKDAPSVYAIAAQEAVRGACEGMSGKEEFDATSAELRRLLLLDEGAVA